MKSLFKKYGLSQGHLWGLGLFIFFGLAHSFIANEDYIICFEKELNAAGVSECQSGIPALIPYSHSTLDKDNRSVGPFDEQKVSSLYYRHWLGTDVIGRDVLAGLLAGSAIALKIGLFSVLLSLILGSLLGYLSGYIGDDGFKLPRGLMISYLLVLTIAAFYFYYGSTLARVGTLVLVLAVTLWATKKSSSYPRDKKQVALPLDLIVMRVIEVFRSIPTLFVLLVLLGIVRTPTLGSIIIIIALLRWPSITRYLRAEILKLKEAQFVKSAQALGLSRFRVFWDHILPLSLSPVIVASSFAVSTAILLESTLSFLGLGLTVDQVSWGSILNNARTNFDHWWLAFFPGLLIYLVIYLFNSIGDGLSNRLRA